MAIDTIFLSWSFTPMSNPRAIQVGRLADHWTLGPLDVTCGGAKGSSVTRNKAGRCDLTVRRYPDRLGSLALTIATRSISTDFGQNPDLHIFWARSITRPTRRVIAGKSNPVLVSYGNPMSDHLAASKLKAETDVPWIAHFSDPWADNPLWPRGPSTQRRILRWERQVIERADKVVFTSAETVELVMRKYPDDLRRKISVIPHAYPAEPYPDATRGNDEKFRIRYMGNFYGARNPLELIRTLMTIKDEKPELMDQVRFEFYGERDKHLKAQLRHERLDEEIVSFGPNVDYETSLKLMAEADALLILDAPADESVFLPSKLVDYLGSGRPLIGITPPGTAANIIRSLGFPVCNSMGASEMVGPLKEILMKLKQGQYSHSYRTDAYHPNNVTEAMERLVSEAAGGR